MLSEQIRPISPFWMAVKGVPLPEAIRQRSRNKMKIEEGRVFMWIETREEFVAVMRSWHEDEVLFWAANSDST